MSLLGTVNVITEDRAYLGLIDQGDDDFYLGDIRIRVVDLVESLDAEAMASRDFSFNVYVSTQYLPTILPDKYLILSGREYFKRQFDTIEKRNKQMFTVIKRSEYNSKEWTKILATKFINETFVKLDSYVTYDRYVYQLLRRQDVSLAPNAQIVDLISQVMDGHETLTRRDIIKCIKKVGF
jgi:hypothetical protein